MSALDVHRQPHRPVSLAVGITTKTKQFVRRCKEESVWGHSFVLHVVNDVHEDTMSTNYRRCSSILHTKPTSWAQSRGSFLSWCCEVTNHHGRISLGSLHRARSVWACRARFRRSLVGAAFPASGGISSVWCTALFEAGSCSLTSLLSFLSHVLFLLFGWSRLLRSRRERSSICEGHHREVATSCLQLCKVSSSIKVGGIRFLQGGVFIPGLIGKVHVLMVICCISSVIILVLILFLLVVGVFSLVPSMVLLIVLLLVVGLFSHVGIALGPSAWSRLWRKAAAFPSGEVLVGWSLGLVVLAKQVEEVLNDLVIGQLGALGHDELLLLTGEARAPQQNPSIYLVGYLNSMFLHLSQCLLVLGDIWKERLFRTACCAVEEAFEGTRHLHIFVVLEHSIQVLDQKVKGSFIFSKDGVDMSFDLLPGDSMKARQDIEDGLFALVLEIQLALVKENPLSPFTVVLGLVGEDGNVGVLQEFHSAWSARSSWGTITNRHPCPGSASRRRRSQSPGWGAKRSGSWRCSGARWCSGCSQALEPQLRYQCWLVGLVNQSKNCHSKCRSKKRRVQPFLGLRQRSQYGSSLSVPTLRSGIVPKG